MLSKKLFAENMTALGLIHGKEITETLASIYFEILKPFSDGECISAFKTLLTTSKFFPKPADILEIINERKKLNKSESWESVMKDLEAGTAPKDPLIMRIIKILGGWEYLQGLGYSDLVWVEKRFNEYLSDIGNKELPAITSGEDTGIKGLLSQAMKGM